MLVQRHLAPAAALLLLAGCAPPESVASPPTPAPSASDVTAEPTESPAATASPTPTPTASATAAPTTPPEGGSDGLNVYAMTDTRAGLRLTRELRHVGGPDPVAAAVEAMIAGPEDPDYTSPWNRETEVLDVGERDGAIVVDLSAAARTADIGSQGAELMVQQLVYTATDAAGDPFAPVLLTIEGEPAGTLWGAVVWDEPVVREDPLDVRSLVQIDSPAEAATVTSPVTVAGEAAAFEATIGWSVLGETGVVSEGFTMTSEGQTFAPYTFTVTLEPGTYTVVVTESDPSGGEAGAPMSDSRTITVE